MGDDKRGAGEDKEGLRKFYEQRNWGSRHPSVIPAKAGIQVGWVVLESSFTVNFCRCDEAGDGCRPPPA